MIDGLGNKFSIFPPKLHRFILSQFSAKDPTFIFTPIDFYHSNRDIFKKKLPKF